MAKYTERQSDGTYVTYSEDEWNAKRAGNAFLVKWAAIIALIGVSLISVVNILSFSLILDYGLSLYLHNIFTLHRDRYVRVGDSSVFLFKDRTSIKSAESGEGSLGMVAAGSYVKEKGNLSADASNWFAAETYSNNQSIKGWIWVPGDLYSADMEVDQKYESDKVDYVNQQIQDAHIVVTRIKNGLELARQKEDATFMETYTDVNSWDKSDYKEYTLFVRKDQLDAFNRIDKYPYKDRMELSGFVKTVDASAPTVANSINSASPNLERLKAVDTSTSEPIQGTNQVSSEMIPVETNVGSPTDNQANHIKPTNEKAGTKLSTDDVILKDIASPLNGVSKKNIDSDSKIASNEDLKSNTISQNKMPAPLQGIPDKASEIQPPKKILGVGMRAIRGTIPADVANMVNVPVASGVWIESVQKNSVADQSGFMAGDIVLKFDDHQVDSPESLHNYIATSKTITNAVVFRQGRVLALAVEFK